LDFNESVRLNDIDAIAAEPVFDERILGCVQRFQLAME
jgi:hypothetical protein